MTGSLYIVATPIGNLGDMGERAIDTLKQVDLIAAEDTRHSRLLLQQFSINTHIVSYHDHNEAEGTEKLIKWLQDGKSVALISDAGTPLINDPGYSLVKAAHDNGIKIIPIPGPSAIITALSVCGLATNRFIFEGYLPTKTEARKTKLNELKNETRTLVFFETPHRIIESVKLMQSIFGNQRKVTIARELTKQFEQVICKPLEEICDKLDSKEIKAKGEFVIIVEGEKRISVPEDEILRINQILSEKLSSKDAAVLTAKITGKKKNEVYDLGLKQAKIDNSD